ncbi:hypothetical protein DBR32_06475 [Taibaiella sp. KBW10]|uniref:DUF3078 domain-containing protein n=1 Tax=Taibaiella sp. KBW10 TaxID=2153357 RepID=UPI000F58F884|nr:DUF3078 domain-containing protein [Taibaiella sp. KBW10]RQO31595.1 hypothetical protein DBR32_06475 [Taibaiella sp. KBW10]
MKKGLLFAAALLTALGSLAQLNKVDEICVQRMDENNIDTIAWIKNANVSVGGNQGMLHNWAAGGELSSLAVNGVFNGNIVRYYNRNVWTNTLDANYGMFYAYSNSFEPRKTDDRLDFTSKYGYRLKPVSNWYLSGLLNAKSQFSKGFNYDQTNWRDSSTSGFLSPLYVLVSPGIEYRRGSMFSVFLSPAAMRSTFVSKEYTSRDEAGAFGVPYNKTMRFEVGAYMSARFQKDLTKTITYRSRLDLYSNYLAKNTYDDMGKLVKKDNPGNVDILFDNFLAFKFFKFFSANFGLTAIYDNDVPFVPLKDAMGNPVKEPLGGLGWWQIKQSFTLGFAYKF